MLCATVSACPTRIVSTVTSYSMPFAVRGQTRRPQLPPSQSTSSVVRSAPRGSGLVTQPATTCCFQFSTTYAQMGFDLDVRPAFLRIPGTREDKLLDFVARCPGNRDASVGVDLTVVATMAAKYLTGPRWESLPQCQALADCRHIQSRGEQAQEA